MMRTIVAAMLVGIATGCSSVPKAPVVDEQRKEPANSSTALELEICRGQISDVRAELRDSQALANGRSTALAQAYVEQMHRGNAAAHVVAANSNPDDRASLDAPAASAGANPNVIWIVRFAFDSAAITVPAGQLERIVEQARRAAYVVVKGRTDGRVESPGESRIAQERTSVMYEVLVRGGVDPRKIALTWQAVGDYLADNSTREGRAANRRVEVEMYRVVPERVVATTATADVGEKL